MLNFGSGWIVLPHNGCKYLCMLIWKSIHVNKIKKSYLRIRSIWYMIIERNIDFVIVMILVRNYYADCYFTFH